MGRHQFRFVYDEINVITLAVVAIAVAAVIWLLDRLWRRIIKERDQLRAEMPGAIVGELLTRADFVNIHSRLFDVEAKLEYVEERLDAHLADGMSEAEDDE